ncbi:M16 family metallopeptidase [Nitrospirota bacterium]
MTFKKTKLDNGITLLMERIDNVRSVSLGIWVRTGSRDEKRESAGISHFLEHMFFKGTESRSAQDIAIAIDSLGGELNAFTSKECTTFYIKVLDDFLDNGIELLADIFLRSTFPTEEIEREKGVVTEEIRLTEDTPDDYIHDLFSFSAWGDGNIGLPVLGSELSVNSIRREHLVDYVNTRYSTDNIIISCAGNFDEDRLISRLNKALDEFDRKEGLSVPMEKAVFSPGAKILNRELSEAHICIGVQGIRQASEDRYAALLLNTALGGGISSRLFQEIREKRGLAYSVYSYLSSYLDNGMWGIYAGASPERAEEVVDISIHEMKKLVDTVDEIEIERARTQLKGNILLGLESTSRRMQNIANQEIYYGRYYGPDEIIEKINSVSVDNVRGIGRRMLEKGSPCIVALGRLDPALESRWSKIQF